MDNARTSLLAYIYKSTNQPVWIIHYERASSYFDHVLMSTHKYYKAKKIKLDFAISLAGFAQIGAALTTFPKRHR